MSDGVRCMWMRGGTSKGGYFIAGDLPSDPTARDTVLLRIMGSPDLRQIDGMGGGDTLTSKVAVVSPSAREDADVDYLFLQVSVDQALVSDGQNCGNILAGVGPFAIERGLVRATAGDTEVRIHMVNTGQLAVARIQTPQGRAIYHGNARIDGVPGTAAAVPITFQNTAGSTCGALFPTGNVRNLVEGYDVTLIDNGMPCVVLKATDFGLTGQEPPALLDADHTLRARLEAIRLAAGHLMNLGDVSGKTIPKMTLCAPPVSGGTVATRTFIPHQCHKAVGVLGAVSIATACLTQGTILNGIAMLPDGPVKPVSIEHPTGEMTVIGHMKNGEVIRTDVLRTSRKLMDGIVF